jgi:hypothetical protein
MPKFEFDPVKHIYTSSSGQRLISVTECLPKSQYMKNCDEACTKGNYVHRAVQLYLLNDLNEDTLDPALVPYLAALKKFLSDSKGMGLNSCVIDVKSGVKVSTVELQISAYIELVNHGRPMNDYIKEYDIKEAVIWLEEPFMHPLYGYCGTPDIVIGDYPIKEGHALYLKDTGKYKLETIPNVRRNFETFLCFLNSYRWSREHGFV